VAAGGTLYDTAGVGRLGALAGALVFWRAILAKASRMDEPFCGTGAEAAGSLPCMEASKPGGGLPGGVVEALGGDGALSFCLNDSSMDGGNVWPLSQISRSFLIFSYRKSVSEHSFLVRYMQESRCSFSSAC
jgi:hypothetical protein